jgi:hypothetical protein
LDGFFIFHVDLQKIIIRSIEHSLLFIHIRLKFYWLFVHCF